MFDSNSLFRFGSVQDCWAAIGSFDEKWHRSELSSADIEALFEPIFFLEERLAGSGDTDAAIRMMEVLRDGKLRCRNGVGSLAAAIWNHMRCDLLDEIRRDKRRRAKLEKIWRQLESLKNRSEKLSRPDNMEGREDDHFRLAFSLLAPGAFSIGGVRKKFLAAGLCPDRCHRLVEGLLAGEPKGVIAKEMGISAPSFTRLKDKTLAILTSTKDLWANGSLIDGQEAASNCCQDWLEF